MEEKFILSKDLFDKLLSGQNKNVNTFIEVIECENLIDKTKTLSYIHSLKLDGKKLPRVNDLVEFLALRLINYAIPPKEIRQAQEKDMEEGGMANATKLYEKAKKLFTSLKTTGEGGEILLYILVEEFLKIPQLISKMPLKTNPNVHYHGVDGIHASFDDKSSKMFLYWGEAKMHKTYGKAIQECFDSLDNFLQVDASTDRDIELITDNLDLLDENFQNAIVNYLDKENEDYNNVEFRGVAMVGFDCSKYPSVPHSLELADMIANIDTRIDTWRNKVKSSINSHTNLDKFVIHIFLLPFPDIQEFRNMFLTKLGFRNKDE